MKKLLAITAVSIIAGYLAYRQLATDDLSLIRRKLERVAELATVTEQLSPFELGNRANQVADLFLPDGTIIVRLPSGREHRIEGAREIRQAILAAGTQLRPFEVTYLDLKIQPLEDTRPRQAQAFATVRARNHAERWEEIVEVRLTLRKLSNQGSTVSRYSTGKEWLIERVENTETLER